MTVQGKFKMQAHPNSGVVMDIAAFKVSHSVGCDIDATALRAARARSSSIGAMDNSSRKVQNACAHSILFTHKATHCQFSRAMERFICGFDWHKNSLRPAKTKGVSNSVCST
jgi:hypothetical protein